jgi:hypothetical protein
VWQEIVIIIIAIMTVLFIVYKAAVFLKKPASPCDKCTGCPLKEQVKGNKPDCKDFEKKPPISEQKIK